MDKEIVLRSVLCSLVMLLFLAACSENSEFIGDLAYKLPDGWEVLEDKEINAHHRKVQIVTPAGSFTELELLRGDQASNKTREVFFPKCIIM